MTKYLIEVQRTVIEFFEVEAISIDEARSIGDDLATNSGQLGEYAPDSYTEYDSHVTNVQTVETEEPS